MQARNYLRCAKLLACVPQTTIELLSSFSVPAMADEDRFSSKCEHARPLSQIPVSCRRDRQNILRPGGRSLSGANMRRGLLAHGGEHGAGRCAFKIAATEVTFRLEMAVQGLGRGSAP